MAIQWLLFLRYPQWFRRYMDNYILTILFYNFPTTDSCFIKFRTSPESVTFVLCIKYILANFKVWLFLNIFNHFFLYLLDSFMWHIFFFYLFHRTSFDLFINLLSEWVICFFFFRFFSLFIILFHFLFFLSFFGGGRLAVC